MSRALSALGLWCLAVVTAIAVTVGISTGSPIESAKEKTANSRDVKSENQQNRDAKTGPAVGARVPGFSLPDQNGKVWRFDDLIGKKGLLLVFTRSADW
jgi:hypothetical protein